MVLAVGGSYLLRECSSGKDLPVFVLDSQAHQ